MRAEEEVEGPQRGPKDRGGSWRVTAFPRGPSMESKGCCIDVEILQATGLREEHTWGREEMSPGI